MESQFPSHGYRRLFAIGNFGEGRIASGLLAEPWRHLSAVVREERDKEAAMRRLLSIVAVLLVVS